MDAPAEPAAVHARAGISLRLQIHLLLAGLMLVFLAVLAAQHIDNTRRSVHEEISGANVVASQLLERVSWVYRSAGTAGMASFLHQLGRVRANDIRLADDKGVELFRSPPSPYKQGRDAPAWFTHLVAPPPQSRVIQLPDGVLSVVADPSRAILDGWDDLIRVMAVGAVVLLVLNLLGLWLVGRAVRPFGTIVAGLKRLQQGDYAARLPALPGREAGTIGTEVNRMAAAIESHLQDRLRALQAERSLAESRETARLVEHRTEQERRQIARELHDELGQSVTAIGALAKSLVQRMHAHDAEGAQAAQLITDEAARLYEAMHGMIPRLSPMSLDSLGLADTLGDLVHAARGRHPGVRIGLAVQPLPAQLGDDTALAAYRTVQEALTNALRHSGAAHIDVAVRMQGEGATAQLDVQVRDDGRGLPPDWQRAGHYGLRGLRERVLALGGQFSVGPAGEHGTCVHAQLPPEPTGEEVAA